MRLVRTIIESPYAAPKGLSDVESAAVVVQHVTYARRAMADALGRGESPLASHLLFTQPGVLRDGDPAERALGIRAGFAWGKCAERVAVYMDYGVSSGMQAGITHATKLGIPVDRRVIGLNPEEGKPI